MIRICSWTKQSHRQYKYQYITCILFWHNATGTEVILSWVAAVYSCIDCRKSNHSVRYSHVPLFYPVWNVWRLKLPPSTGSSSLKTWWWAFLPGLYITIRNTGQTRNSSIRTGNPGLHTQRFQSTQLGEQSCQNNQGWSPRKYWSLVLSQILSQSYCSGLSLMSNLRLK